MSTKITINRFDGAIVNDPRDTAVGASRVVTNFDIITKQGSLIPYRRSVDGNSNSTNDLMRNWCVALRTGTTYSLYGLGRQTAASKVRIFYKNLTTGAATDLDDNGWTEGTKNLGTQITPSYECFVYYKNANGAGGAGLIFGLHAGRYIWSYDPTEVSNFGDTLFDLTSFTNTAQGVVHSKDDVLYIPVDNFIYSKNASAAFSKVFTLPAQFYITSICEYNNYLAIAAAPLGGIGNSRVFIWDRSSTLATVTENIDWGYGVIKVLEEIGGYLIGISLDQTTRFNDRMTFRYYTGSGSIAFKEILGASASQLLTWKQKINNRIYFAGEISLNGTVRSGVWSFGKNSAGVFNLIHERTPNNDTAISSQGINGFFYIGDYLFIGYTTAGSAGAVSKTDDTGTYTASTSIYESLINPGMPTAHKTEFKQLTSVTVNYSSLPAAGQVVLKYKVDGGSNTTIFTETTDNAVTTTFKSANGVPFTSGTDYEFRLESTGGAEITRLDYEYELIPT